MIPKQKMKQWKKDCLHWRHEVLTGIYSHWCLDWDGLPVDETCEQFISCGCIPESEETKKLKKKLRKDFDASVRRKVQGK